MSIELLTWSCGVLLLLVSFVQFGLVIGFCRWLISYQSIEHNAPLPHAAVILSVRGESSSLHACLNALSLIDYPSFEIHIVVDSENDRSIDAIREWQRQDSPNSKHVHILNDISSFCSLKTSAVRQCIKSLSDEVQAVAILDADTIVHKEWLSELVSPLLQDRVGASTGNRWYDSTATKPGNQIRFLYNAWAVPGMHFMNTIWGGTLGIHQSVFKHPEFLDKLANTPTEETGVQDIRTKIGMSLAKQGNLMMDQPGDIAFIDSLGFITRQLLWTRLHYREWVGILIGPFLIYAVTVCLTVCAVFSALYGEWSHAFLAGGIFLAYWIINWCLIVHLDRTVVAKIAQRGGRHDRRFDWVSRFQLFVMIPVGFLVFLVAILKAQFVKTIRWSGIQYRVVSPRGIQLIEYRPVGK